MGRNRNILTDDEIKELLDGQPKVGGPKELSEVIGYAKSTIYEWFSAGRLKGAARKRGKRIMISLPKALRILFNGPEWTN